VAGSTGLVVGSRGTSCSLSATALAKEGDDTQIGGGTMAHTVPIAFSSYSGMDIGRDNGLVVDLAYEDQAPYHFTGRIEKVTFDLAPVTHEEAQALHQHANDHSVGSGVAG